MTNTEQMREAFEAFAQNNPMGRYNIDRRGDGYDSSHTQLMWLSWQAALTAPAAEVPEAMGVVAAAMLNDPEYAWAWHCNIAMAAFDEGLSHYAANKAAARFLSRLAQIDMTTHPDFPKAPEQSAAAGVSDEQCKALTALFKDAMDWGRSYGQRINLSSITVADVSEAYSEKARAILALRPQAVPMTDEQVKAARRSVCDDPDELPEPWAFRMGIRAAEAHHGITAPAGGEG